MAEENPRDVVVRFGKHNGKTLEQVAEADLAYLTWLASMDGKPTISVAARKLLAMPEFKRTPGDTVMPFGKYDGTTLQEIYDQDYRYFDWLLENVDLNDQLRADIEAVMD